MTDAWSGLLFAWLVLPLLIFTARILDVSLGTVRVIFVARGYKYLAPLIGFFEVLVWLLAIGQIMKNLSNPVSYIAYALGFAAGNYVGMLLAEKLSLGMVMVRVLTSQKADPLIALLKAAEYGLTSVDGQGVYGPVKVIFTVVPRHHVEEVIRIIKTCNPQAFYTIEEINTVSRENYPRRRKTVFSGISGIFRPFRKGK